MKKLLLGITFLASMSSFAGNNGATLKANHFTLNMGCAQEVSSINECKNLTIITTFLNTGEQRILELPSGDKEKLKGEFRDFLSEVYPKEGSNYNREKESLTVFGKVLVGWFRLPLAAISDQKLMESIEVNKLNYEKYIDLLSSSESRGKIINENKDSPLLYFSNRMEQFAEASSSL